jgi:hypothetical protein
MAQKLSVKNGEKLFSFNSCSFLILVELFIVSCGLLILLVLRNQI